MLFFIRIIDNTLNLSILSKYNNLNVKIVNYNCFKKLIWKDNIKNKSQKIYWLQSSDKSFGQGFAARRAGKAWLVSILTSSENCSEHNLYI